MKKLIIAVVLLLSICGCTQEQQTEIKQVTCNEKDEILEKNKQAMLIDVRTEEEYKEKHLDDAINIPYDVIGDTIETYGTIDFDTPIIVYCKSGGRSSQAAETLKDKGYTKIYDLGAISNCD